MIPLVRGIVYRNRRLIPECNGMHVSELRSEFCRRALAAAKTPVFNVLSSLSSFHLPENKAPHLARHVDSIIDATRLNLSYVIYVVLTLMIAERASQGRAAK